MAQPQQPRQPRQSLTDLAYRTAAGILGGPVDIATMVMRPLGYRVPDQQVVGGSEWMGRQMERAGLISSARAPVQELLTSLLVPTPSGAGTAISKAIFIGAAAKTWDAAAAAKAKELEKAGADARSIWQQTGTWKGPDGKWRQEIDDSQAKFLAERLPQAQDRLNIANQYLRDAGVPAPRDIASPDRLVSPALKQEALQFADMKVAQGAPSEDLSKVLQHGKAFMSYPDMGSIPIAREIGGGPIRGTYDPAMNRMTVGGGTIRDAANETKSTTLHELQHAIQQREGFARGGSERSAADEVATMIFDKKKRSSDIQKSAEFQEAQALENKLGWEAIEGKVPFEQYERTITNHPGYPLLAEYRQLQEWLRTAPSSGLEAYRRLAGEAEARAVQARMNLTPAERRATFPPESYDVPIEQLIIRGIE